MKTIRKFATLAAGIALAAAAHAGTDLPMRFDAQKPVRLSGSVNRIESSSSNVLLFIDVTDVDGSTKTWTCETNDPQVLAVGDHKRLDLRQGDRLVIDGYLAKDGARSIDARRVKLELSSTARTNSDRILPENPPGPEFYAGQTDAAFRAAVSYRFTAP